GTKTERYASLAKLFASLSSKLKMQRYQIQQGLRLIQVGKRPVDFRALVQKNQAGEWSVTSIVGRIAGNQHFVSNIARGGTLCPAKEAILKSNMAGSKSAALAGLRSAALDIAKAVDRQIPEHFGELGIDLAV